METPSKCDILQEFCPIFEHCRCLWANWSPSWNVIFAPGFFCATRYALVVYGKIVWAMFERFIIPKNNLVIFGFRYFRNLLPPTWRAWAGHRVLATTQLSKCTKTRIQSVHEIVVFKQIIIRNVTWIIKTVRPQVHAMSHWTCLYRMIVNQCFFSKKFFRKREKI